MPVQFRQTYFGHVRKIGLNFTDYVSAYTKLCSDEEILSQEFPEELIRIIHTEKALPDLPEAVTKALDQLGSDILDRKT